jgi:hypothetical protein
MRLTPPPMTRGGWCTFGFIGGRLAGSFTPRPPLRRLFTPHFLRWLDGEAQAINVDGPTVREILQHHHQRTAIANSR